MPKLRVLVVDDTIVYRKIISDILTAIPGVEVVGTANNGKIAVSKIQTLRPDLVTLDVEMPEMNGLEVLEAIGDKSGNTGVVMLSTLTTRGGDITIRALELGAFDFVPKPQSGSMQENLAAVRNRLVPIIEAFKRRMEIRAILHKGKGRPLDTRIPAPTGLRKTVPARRPVRNTKSEIITLGISTGGPNALARMMPEIPADIGVPILIVQHMPPVFTASLAKSLDAKCAIRVKEAEHGEAVFPNVAYIAPGGSQMRVAGAADGRTRIIEITDAPPENSCKPSADYLFRSVSRHYVGRATGVIMTGMGSDGFRGLEELKENGAHIIAQDEASCTVYGMPRKPIETGLADVIAPLSEIAAAITRSVRSQVGTR